MTDAHREDREPVEPAGDEPTGPAWPDKTDPATHQPAGHAGQGGHGGDASAEPGGEDEYDIPADLSSLDDTPPAQEPDRPDGDEHPDTRRAAEHLEDLRRVQAEYVNYKKRVDRDRDVARDRGVTQVVEALLPVLDDIHAARQHGDLEGTPSAAIADKLEGILGRFGVTSIGEPGQAFDPAIHEALMHVEAELAEDATTTTVVQVIQPGFKMGDRVVRPARVSVADPT